jgi:hypothetical protein
MLKSENDIPVDYHTDILERPVLVTYKHFLDSSSAAVIHFGA